MPTTETITNTALLTGISDITTNLRCFLAHDVRDYILFQSGYDVRSGDAEYTLILADNISFGLTQFTAYGHLTKYIIDYTAVYGGARVPFGGETSGSGIVGGTEGEIFDYGDTFTGYYRIPCYTMSFVVDNSYSDSMQIIVDTDYSGSFNACYSSIGDFPDLREGVVYNVSAVYSLGVVALVVALLCAYAFRKK